MIAEFLSYDFSCMQKIPETHKMFVVPVFLIIPYASALLARHKRAAVERSGRNSDHSVKMKAMIHKNIQHAGCIDSSHGSAFQNQSCFHVCSPSYIPTVLNLSVCFPEADPMVRGQSRRTFILRIADLASVRQCADFHRGRSKRGGYLCRFSF